MMNDLMKDLAIVLCVNIMASRAMTCAFWDQSNVALPMTVAVEMVEKWNYQQQGTNQEDNLLQHRCGIPLIEIPPHQIILYRHSFGSDPSYYIAAKSTLNGTSVGRFRSLPLLERLQGCHRPQHTQPWTRGRFIPQ